MDPHSRISVYGRICFFLIFFTIFITFVNAADVVADTSLVSQVNYNGNLIDEHRTGPGLPPPGWVANANVPDLTTVIAVTASSDECGRCPGSFVVVRVFSNIGNHVCRLL
jgi:hypothetical protein